jgi:hypothetical protein
MIECRDYPDVPGCNVAGPSEPDAAEIGATVKTPRGNVFSTITTAPRGLEVAAAKATDFLHEADHNLPRFDFSLIPELKQTVERLCGLYTAITANRIEIGTELRFIKTQYPGQFVALVERELPFSVKTAQRLMKLSKFAEGKNDTVSLLPYSAALTLSRKSTPLKIVEQVLARVRSGEIVRESDVEKMISDDREELRFAQRQAEDAALNAARKTEKEKKAAERAIRRVEKERKQKSAEAKAKSIVDHLSPADLIFIAAIVDDRGVLDELFEILQHVRAGNGA